MSDGVGRLVIDDGKVNAMSRGLIGDIDQALGQAERDQVVLVIEGRPGIFSAGFHLGELRASPEQGRDLTVAGALLAGRLMRYPDPLIAGCTGHAFPMGAFLLMSCDYVMGVAGDFRLGLNEVAIGITVPRFAVELARYRLAPSHFRRTVTQGEMFDPPTALAAGLLDAVVPPARLEQALAERAAASAALDRSAFRRSKARAHRQFLALYHAEVEDELAAAAG